jgi:hypothetical protein
MKIKKDLLVEKLALVKPGLSNKDIIEFADSVSFNKNQIITYNDFICIRCPLDINIKGTVKADRLYAHMNKVKADKEGYVKISVKGEELLIAAGKSKVGLPINLDGLVSLDELGKPVKKWKKLPSDFIEGVRLSIFAAGHDMSDPKLTCIHINGTQIQASNGHRAFRYQMESKIKKEFLLPATSAPAILNHPITKYAVTKEWVHFKTKDETIISCRMYADTSFMDTDFLFDIKGVKVIFPDSLKSIIDNAIIFIGEDEDDKNIRIAVEKKEIKIRSESATGGWFKEKIKAKSKNEVSFEINPFFLQDILKTSTTAILSPKIGLLKFESDKWEYSINIAAE